MMRKVFLHGRLKKVFGPQFQFDVATAGEALRALNCAFPGAFVAELKQGYYRVIRGDYGRSRRKKGMDLELDLVNSLRLGNSDLHIVPATAGAAGGEKKGGTIKLVAGVALVGAAIFLSGGTLAAPLAAMGQAISIGGFSLGVTWGNMAIIGLGLALAGASTLLAKPDPAEQDKKDDSFTLSGAVNVNEQGVPVPLIYGAPITGGIPVSAGLDIEDVNAYPRSLDGLTELVLFDQP